jgi:hypothetical protein
MRPRMIVSGAAGLLLLLGGAAMVSVANASSPDTGVFNERAMGATGDCLTHQKAQPSKLYTGGTAANTGRVLRMMRYYMVNGNKTFCDGKPASAADRAWAQLYVDLGGNAAKVAAVHGA